MNIENITQFVKYKIIKALKIHSLSNNPTAKSKKTVNPIPIIKNNKKDNAKLFIMIMNEEKIFSSFFFFSIL